MKPKQSRRVQIARGEKRRPVCYRVGPDTIAFMRTRANQAEFFENLVEASPEYQEWLKTRNKGGTDE